MEVQETIPHTPKSKIAIGRECLSKKLSCFKSRDVEKDDDSDVTKLEPEEMSAAEIFTTVCSIILIVLTFPISVFLCFEVVQEYERALIFRLGRLKTGGIRGPGIYFRIPCIETFHKVDLRTVSFDVPVQQVLTKDSVTISVDAVVYYHVQDPLSAILKVHDYRESTRLLAATNLRTALSSRRLSAILEERGQISQAVQTALDAPTDPWGVLVERIEIKDIRLPSTLQRAMAAEAEASREARAHLIAAQGEADASRALREASDTMSGNPAAMQLRYLQTLSAITNDKSSTIVFPIPIDLMRSLQIGHSV
ncbi:band 7 protein AGAP004871-like isoform X1 [Ischnura elegans]|uniref:band 7 protein AGAP004871-like isoform X1 n=1 Tax=Ischnura elegans TaxID=197161 RepID=UPI001ED8675B|nr:band 7 protein AGAP004871-like isoform X1 [Ischnura elegans]